MGDLEKTKDERLALQKEALDLEKEKAALEEDLEEEIFVDEIEELQLHFANPWASYPHFLVERMVEQREQTIPKLLANIEEFFTHSLRDASKEKWREIIFTFLILAKLREKKAFPYVVRLLTFPYKTMSRLVDDIIADYDDRLLASTFDGDLKTLYSLVSNQYLHEYTRWAALDAYIILYMQNVISRQETLDTYSKFFDELHDDFSVIPGALVVNCCNIRATELSEQIKKYFDEGLVDPMLTGPEIMKESFSLSQDKALEQLEAGPQNTDFIDDIEQITENLFEKYENLEDSKFIDPDGDMDIFTHLTRSTPKIGRNDPCPCNSGKKYKKCCLTD